MTEESPWSKFDLLINLVLLLIWLSFSTVLLILKSAWLFLALFWVVFVGGYMVLGRYVTCRHCDFLGKPCPSWMMGIIGGKMFSRSDKKNFCVDGGFIKAALLDMSFLILAVLLPLLAYILAGIQPFDWVLLGLYLILVLALLIVHSLTGCKKCPIADCPLCGQKQK